MLFSQAPEGAAAGQLNFPRILGWIILFTLLLPPDVRGQDPEDEIPAPEDLTLVAKDGMLVRATYLAGTHEKESVPVILLHGYKGDRHDMDKLAFFLQSQGHAVIAPDLRGHGESKEIRVAGSEQTLKIDAAKFGKDDFDNMINFDLEAIKAFLKEKNNEEQLNIDKLCVVGTGMGAVIAAGWTQFDWAAQPFATGKQGQDVKALVMISPESNFRGLHLADATNDPAVRSQVAILLIAGRKGGKTAREVRQLFNGFKKYHTDPEKQDLSLFLPDTSVQGAKLLSEPSLNVAKEINEFVFRLVKRQIPWAERKSPLD